jgi:cyclopropane fatty-acyl-phospholipid synthase-like methyltransferase
MDSLELKYLYDDNYFINIVAGHNEFKQGKINNDKKYYFNLIDVKNKSVLDVGFGRGEILKLAELNDASMIVGIDYSESAYNIARNSICSNRIKLYNLNIVDIDKITQTNFNCIYMIDILEHVNNEEISIFLNKARKKFTKDCVLISATPLDIRRGDYKGMHFNQYNYKRLKQLFLPMFKTITIKVIKGEYICICKDIKNEKN